MSFVGGVGGICQTKHLIFGLQDNLQEILIYLVKPARFLAFSRQPPTNPATHRDISGYPSQEYVGLVERITFQPQELIGDVCATISTIVVLILGHVAKL